MFERFKTALMPSLWTRSRSAPLARWAQDHALAFHPVSVSAYHMTGQWHGRPVRIQCATPSRPFIKGLELTARADFGLQPEGQVVVMNRRLKELLDDQSQALYSQYTDALQTSAGFLPEEVRWLAMYRDAGWAGPSPQFWSRYSVLTDSPELARRWIDTGVEQRLMSWPSGSAEGIPMMFMWLRGKTYMRLQIDRAADMDTAVHACELFQHLGERAWETAAR